MHLQAPRARRLGTAPGWQTATLCIRLVLLFNYPCTRKSSHEHTMRTRTNYANTRSCMIRTCASMHVGISARPRTRTQAISDDRAPFA